MGKRKPTSLLKRDHDAKRAKAGPRPKPQPGAAQPTASQWQPISLLHRQAAHAVARLLRADATGRHGASLKSLTLAPHIVNKKAVYAVTIETLKHGAVLQGLLERCALVEANPRLSVAVAHVLIRDLLFGEGVRAAGPAEAAVLDTEPALREALQQMLDAAGVGTAAELLPRGAEPAPRPRTARVNTLRMSVAQALSWLRAPPAEHEGAWAAAGQAVAVDPLIPELLVFPPGTSLHDNPLVAAGALIQQSKASCMTAAALAPRPGWRVLDACAAPGNKTTQLAAMLSTDVGASLRSGRSGKRPGGSVIALDKDPVRLRRLQGNVEAAGAGGVVGARCADFLSLDPSAPEWAGVKAVLLDPSCSGSGTAASRMDHLLPSAAQRAAAGGAALAHTDARVEALAAFQETALRHALRFPAARRVAYSTCSLHARENEGVVGAVLAEARAAGWELEAALPEWPRRGVAHGAVGEAEAGKLLRTDPEEDGTDGFFVALFVRRKGAAEGGKKARRAAGEKGAL